MAPAPRYVELAQHLRKAIASARFPVGALLPTELDLCARHDVSRHTARAALKLLEEEGLIERRPGLGTRVIAPSPPAAFSQRLGGLDDLLQYAHEAQLSAHAVAHTTLGAKDAAIFGVAKGSSWLRIDGVRRAKGAAIAATSIFVSSALGARAADFRETDLAVVELIERRFGVSVSFITQKITAETLNASDAALLQRNEGAAILRTVRRYYDAAERPYVLSDSRHPGDVFAYEMSYRRAAGVAESPIPDAKSKSPKGRTKAQR
jgi:GntR family transcriptional regulator